jgi:hypothetical protein
MPQMTLRPHQIVETTVVVIIIDTEVIVIDTAICPRLIGIIMVAMRLHQILLIITAVVVVVTIQL